MQISFAVFDGVEELDLVGPWEFAGLLAMRGYCAAPRLISLGDMAPVGEHGMRFSADAHHGAAQIPDVLVVPGGSGARRAMLDPAVLSFLQRSAAAPGEILSVCTGSYLLQAAGLLRGRRAVTHWCFLDHLRDDPDIVLDERRVVRDGNIWTCGGVSSGMDMMLAFIAARFGEEVAAQVQLDAEYFPEAVIYGAPLDDERLTRYLRELGQSA